MDSNLNASFLNESSKKGFRMKNIIEINHLVKKFEIKTKKAGFLNKIKSLAKSDIKEIKAVDNISFEVKQGDIIGFIGPNGAGKSTTIKMLTGILFPTSGNISVLGLNPQKQRVKLAYSIGTVFGQKPQLWLHLPAIDTFNLLGEIYEVDEKEFNDRMEKLVDLFEIKDLINTPVRKLSLGQRMRCEIVAALLHNPKIIFLDEPTIGLDIIAKKKIRSLLKKLNEEEGTTIILTSHDLEDIEKLCNQLIIINKGKIVYNNSMSEVNKFLRTKIIELYFEDKVKEFKLPKNAKIKEKSPYKLVVEIDTKKISTTSFLDYFFKNYEVADLVIREAPIEELIEEIYKN
jgi:ABC-2 type transport system ATP-binding protein